MNRIAVLQAKWVLVYCMLEPPGLTAKMNMGGPGITVAQLFCW
jgi:hypothetical protein